VKKLVITDYQVPAPDIPANLIQLMLARGWTAPAEEKPVNEATYGVKQSLLTLLFHQELRIDAKDLLKRDDLARKIDSCQEDFILLEEAEYTMIRAAVETIHGFDRNDVQLVRRILEAETVEVQEKKTEGE
jgi:hypothetical protein